MMTLHRTQRLAGLGGTRSPITRPYDAYLNGVGIFETHPLIVVGGAALVAYGLGFLFGRHAM